MNGSFGAGADSRRTGRRAWQLRGIGHIGQAGASIATRIKVGVVFGVFEAGMPLGGLLAGGEPRGRWGDVAGYAGGTLLIGMGSWVLDMGVFRVRPGYAARRGGGEAARPLPA